MSFKPIQIGARVVVHGIDYASAFVSNVTWVPDEARWLIALDWGIHGTSRVYNTDENKTWYRYASTN